MPQSHHGYNNCSTEDGTDQQCTSGPDVWDGGVNRRSYNSKKTPLVRPSSTNESRPFAQEDPFRWLPQRRPPHGTKLRWKDRIRKDLKKFSISEGSWFAAAQGRRRWRGLWKKGLETCTKIRIEVDQAKRQKTVNSSCTDHPAGAGFTCDICQTSLRQDIARHRCVTTHPKRRTS